MINKEEFISNLNMDLELEYSAAIQYIQHASVILGPEYGAASKEFIVHANEEIAHAILLANIINDLGGVPTVSVGERYVSNSTQEMLEQDLGGEEVAIKRYKERIKQAEELEEFGVRQNLETILVDEEEHRRDVLNFLGR